ncbi:MAG: hypothetical protein NVS2B3_17850 [Vulcanimicrobiaceae bacterium]
MEHEASRRHDLGSFLKGKRAATEPGRFNLPVHRRRRVAGLRREEVALLAGISVTWYTQIESGADITISPALLRRLADVFGLTPLERAYLFTLGIDEMGIVNAVAPELHLLSGSRIACDTFEGEIALALRAHRTIKTQIYSTILHGTLDALVPHLDEERCPIGIWLHDDLACAHRHSAGYSDAARAHGAFHDAIELVVGAGLAGDVARAEQLLVSPSRYALASIELERCLGMWPALVAA